MKKINAQDLGNMVETIAKDWMLVTAGTPESFNTMTANWGGVGYLWNKHVAFVFIRPERHTYAFTEKHDTMTLSFFAPEHKKALQFCGSHSGRDTDKMAETGLTPLTTPGGSVAFEQASMIIEGRKLYSDMISSEHFIDRSILAQWYDGGHGGQHRMYIIEIENIYVK